MKVRPGPASLRFSVGLVALAGLCFFWSPAVWIIVGVGILGIILFGLDARDLQWKVGRVSVQREMPVWVRRNTPFSVTLRIRNSGPEVIQGLARDILPSDADPSFWFQDFHLPPEDEMSLRYTLRILVRGKHRVGPVWLCLRGRFGMLERQHCYESVGEVKVFPDIMVSSDDIRKDSLAEKNLLDQLSQTRLRGEGMEFESLSRYQPGDDLRRVDWRSSARHRQLMVRRYQVEQHRDVMILIDCGRLMGTDVNGGTKLDRAVGSALMLSRVALEGGDRCGLGIFDDKIRGYLPPVSGPNALRTVTDSIFDVQCRWHESNFSMMFAALQTRQIKRSLVVILSDIVDADTSERFRTALASLTHRHVVVLAALRTPFLQQTLKAPVGSFRDVARKAVAVRILQEREKALHYFHRAGIRILDVEPTDLTVPLVNQYIQLRERNLL